MKQKTLKLLKTTALLLLIFLFPFLQAQTVKTFAGKAYIGSGSYNGNRNNHKDSTFFSAPNGIEIDTAGRIYISNEHNIMLITGTNCKLAAGYNLDPNSPGAADSKDGTGPAARFSSPAALSVNPATNDIYVADVDNHQIRKVSAFFNNSQDPQVTTFAGVKLLNGSYLNSTNAASKFNQPVGLTAASNGDIYVADRNNHCIRKISGGNVTTIGGKQGVQGHANGTLGTSTFDAPWNVFLDGNFLYVADYGNSAIRKIDLTDNTVTDFITTGLSAPTDICKADNIWFISQQTCVKKYVNNVLSTYAGSTSTTGNTDGIGGAARFEYINSIAYNQFNKMLYVVDKGNNIIRTISPNNSPICSFTASNLAPTKGQTVLLKSTTINKPTKYKWTITPSNYSLLNSSTLDDSIVYLSFSQTGSYTIKLWASNSGGEDSLTKNSYINVSSVTAIPIPDFIASKTNPVTDEVISLIDQSSNDPTSWKWRITPLTYIFVNGTDSNSRIPNIKFTNGDNYSITLIVGNAQGSASLTKTNYINVNLSGLHNIIAEPQLTIYPNPALDFTNINHDLNGTVTLTDMNGKTVGEWIKNETALTIGIEQFTSGIYFINLQTSEGIIRQKLVIGGR